MKKEKLIAVIVSAAMLLPTNAFAANVSSFKDIPTGWSHDAVAWMVENDLMNGFNGSIAPKKNLTRAEMAAIMNRSMGNSNMGDLSVYTDVIAGSWYYNDMSKAVSAGIFEGAQGKLRPEAPITREEAFLVLSRAAKLTEGKRADLKAFSDASAISEWAVSGIAAMHTAGYIKGSSGKLMPKAYITREEFSQVIYNMKDALKKNKGENSEIKDKETPLAANPLKEETVGKSSGGSSGNSSSSGSGGGASSNNSSGGNASNNSSGGSGSGSNPSTKTDPVETVKLVTEKTKLVDLSWSQFVTVQFTEGNSLKNCSISVDGTDVTAAFTPVSTDGSIVKWEITNLNPSKLTVTRNDGKKQDVELSKNASAKKPQLRTGTSAGYMVAHGPVAVYDYYLPNYDKNGNLRVEPATTLINLNNAPETTDAPAFYSPVAEISEDGKGEVVIMFNQKTDAEKNWFAGIKDRSGSVQLVSHDEYLNTINGKLNFSLATDVPHGKSSVAEVKIPLGQNDFSSNGRYFVRIKSDGHDSVLAPIHVVNAAAPKLTLSGSGSTVSGQNMSFKISGMVYGIKNPTVAADLLGPDGKTARLTMIEDWYQIGDKLFLYNTVNESTNQGKNNIPYNGKYTLTVHSDGFKDMSCTFFVTGGKDYVNEGKTVFRSRLKKSGADAVTSATSGGGSNSGGTSGGGRQISADLKFDADLLINAMLTERIGIENEQATAIVDRWEKDMAGYDTVSAKDSSRGGFDWSDYITAVSNARSEGKYLCFADYAQNNATSEKETIAHSVKSVLEDNKLGDIQMYGSWIGKDTPRLKLVSMETDEQSKAVINEISEVNEGNPAYLLCDDDNYISNITNINLNGNSADLQRNKDFSILKSSKPDGSNVYLIKIKPVDQKFVIDGNNLVKITAKGYKQAAVSINYVSVLENISLKTEKAEYSRGESVVVIVEGSDGSYLKKLVEAVVTKPDGTESRVAHKGYFSFDEYYTVEGNKLVFYDKKNGIFKLDGAYHISLKASGYNDKKTPDFTVKPAENINPPQVTEEVLLKTEKTEYSRGESIVVLVEGSDFNYIKKIREVAVTKPDGTESSVAQKGYFSFDEYYAVEGNKVVLYDKRNSIFKQDGAYHISFKADGYSDKKTAEFTVKSSENTETEQAAAPAIASVDKTSNTYGDSYYEVKLNASSQDELNKYFRAIKSLTVDGVAYNKANYNLNSGDEYLLKGEYGSTGYEYRSIRINSVRIDETKAVTVTVTADGYKDVTFELKGGKLVADTNEAEEESGEAAPAIASVDKTSNTYGDSYYEVKLNASSQDELNKYFRAIKSLTVDGVAYNKAYNFYSGDQYKLYGEYGSTGYEYRSIRINSVRIDEAKAVTVTVAADGYKDVTFELKGGKLL